MINVNFCSERPPKFAYIHLTKELLAKLEATQPEKLIEEVPFLVNDGYYLVSHVEGLYLYNSFSCIRLILNHYLVYRNGRIQSMCENSFNAKYCKV